MTIPSSSIEKKFHSQTITVILLSLIEGLFAFFMLFYIPADPENSLFFGFSASRLMLAATQLLGILFFSIILFFYIKHSPISLRLSHLFLSTGLILLFPLFLLLCTAFIIWCWSIDSPPLVAYAIRLRPVASWMFLVSLQLYFLQVTHGKEKMLSLKNKITEWGNSVCRIFSHFLENQSGVFQHSGLNILMILLVSSPLLLQNALQYKFPVGVAGLYALMAEQIGENHFSLPLNIPFYGPGGIPFAYPPFSFYVMAFFTRVVGIDAITYLRFAAPLFCLLALIPMYLLAKEISQDGKIATLSALTLTTYARIYLIHGQAAGMTRALAFFLCLSGLYFFYRSIRRDETKAAIWSAVFLGLTAMSHPTYVELFAVSATVIILCGNKGQSIPFSKRFKLGVLTALGGVLISSPWWLTTGIRFGTDVFSFASDSHDSLNFLTVILNPGQIEALFVDFMYKMSKSPWMTGPAILAFFWLLVRKEYLLPLWALAYIFIFGGYDFLIIPVTAIMCAMMLAEIYHAIVRERQTEKTSFSLASVLFLSLWIGCGYLTAWKEIDHYHPDLNTSSLELANWFQQHTSTDASFLRLTTSSEEAEWYPYLLRRTPVISSWGAEWTGDYKNQLTAVNRLVSCSIEQSKGCVDAVLSENNVEPEYIIMDSGSEGLPVSYEESTDWIQIYQNAGYLVWQNTHK